MMNRGIFSTILCANKKFLINSSVYGVSIYLIETGKHGSVG
jgi:hypothetical protein